MFELSFFIPPILIFISRILDVSIGTMRIMLVSKGFKYIAPVLGFIEVLIWIIVMAYIVQNLTNPLAYVAYAGGFAAGTYIGMIFEGRIALGKQIIRIITAKDPSKLLQNLSENNFRVTHMKAQGARGEVGVVYTIVKRVDIEKVLKIVKEFNPKAFYTIEDIQYVSSGDIPLLEARKSVFPKSWFLKNK